MQLSDIVKVRSYEFRDAKLLITAKTLAKYYMGPEPNNNALAAERERS